MWIAASQRRTKSPISVKVVVLDFAVLLPLEKGVVPVFASVWRSASSRVASATVSAALANSCNCSRAAWRRDCWRRQARSCNSRWIRKRASAVAAAWPMAS